MTERNNTPEQEWLAVWRHISDTAEGDMTNDGTIDALIAAVQCLYLLLEPPSVREKRINYGL